MSALQVVGLIVMLAAMAVYIGSLVTTTKDQLAGQRLSVVLARLRVAVFGVVFAGAGLFVLGTSVPPFLAISMFAMAGATVAISLVLQFR